MASYECRGKKKLWSVRFEIIENGKSITKRLSGFERKKDAEQSYRNFMEEYEKTTHQLSSPSNILDKNFIDIFEEYKIYKKEKIKDSSFYDLSNNYKKHIKPFFEKYKLKQITKNIILEWQQSISNYSYKYKQNLRTILYSFYKYLYYYYDIDNVVARVEPFKKPNIKKEMQIWTLKEFNNFINTIDNDILFKTFFTFLYYTGCRLGETLAINYNDLDLENKTLNICKSLTTKVHNKIQGQTYSITSPKTSSSYRKILLPQTLINQLKNYINSNHEIISSKFFFGLEKPLDDHTIYRRLEFYTKKCKNKIIRIHDFRHSHASFLIQNGANIVLIAKRLGHTNTEQTLNTYAHLFPNTEQDLIDLINKIA